jgi:hypothetical protein
VAKAADATPQPAPIGRILGTWSGPEGAFAPFGSAMWPTAFALKELTAAEEARIGALVKKAVS